MKSNSTYFTAIWHGLYILKSIQNKIKVVLSTEMHIDHTMIYKNIADLKIYHTIQ